MPEHTLPAAGPVPAPAAEETYCGAPDLDAENDYLVQFGRRLPERERLLRRAALGDRMNLLGPEEDPRAQAALQSEVRALAGHDLVHGATAGPVPATDICVGTAVPLELMRAYIRHEYAAWAVGAGR